jgi:multidrug efflux pump subunit AcrA (membrane-fusion protein)
MSRTAKLEVAVPNPEHSLRPGMLVRLSVEVARRDDVLLAPSDALTITGEHKGGAPVYRAVVVEQGKAVERMVRLGLREGTKVEVLEGLSAGEQLVIRGQHILSHGDAVTIMENTPAPVAAPTAKE